MISFLDLIKNLLQKTSFKRTRHRFRHSKQVEVKMQILHDLQIEFDQMKRWSTGSAPPLPVSMIEKYNLCCSVSSSSSYVLHFFSSDKLMSYTLFGYRLPFTFNFLLTLRSLSVHRTLIFLRSKSWIDSMMFHPLRMKFDIRFMKSSVSTLYLQFLTVQFRWYFK